MPGRPRRTRARRPPSARVGNGPSDETILRLYRQPGHPTAFSGVNAIAKFHNISQKRARAVLDQSETYQTHREYHRPAHFNPFYIRSRRAFAQGDLVEVQLLKRFNGGIRYLFVILDAFTRFMWCYPLKNKEGASVLAVLRRWLDEDGADHFATMTVDGGLEFFNARVKSFLAQRHIRLELADFYSKAAIVERANKSLQSLLYKYMTENSTKRYIDALPALVTTYNQRPHRTLKGMSPAEADLPENEAAVLAIHAKRYADVPKGTVRFKVNDVVRVKKQAKPLTPASRSYNPQFNDEYYYIYAISSHLARPLYKLKTTASSELIQGGFYANEITLVGGDTWKIEKILRRVRRGRRRLALVRWQGFSEQWDSWIPEGDIQHF